MARKLNPETTIWPEVEVSRKATQKAIADARKASEAANAAWAAAEALVNGELRSAGHLSNDESAIFSRKFGKFSMACSKVDGSVIGEVRTSSTGSSKRVFKI